MLFFLVVLGEALGETKGDLSPVTSNPPNLDPLSLRMRLCWLLGEGGPEPLLLLLLLRTTSILHASE